MLHDEQGPRAAFMKPVRQQGRQVSQTAILGSCTISKIRHALQRIKKHFGDKNLRIGNKINTQKYMDPRAMNSVNCPGCDAKRRFVICTRQVLL